MRRPDPEEYETLGGEPPPAAGNPSPWAEPRAGVPVERRDAWEVVTHGARAGVLAGLSLGAVEIAISALLRSNPWLPFDFASAIFVGPAALAPGFPVGASVALGTAIHLLLSVAFGVVFIGGLALTYQLSARPPLMLLYGALFGLAVWEVDFMGILHLVRPELAGRLDLATQLWNGIASYGLVYGPVLAVYVIRFRPGVLDRWWSVAPEEAP